jgi:hypothetical protein
LRHPSRLALLNGVAAARQALTDGQSSLKRVDRKLMMVGFFSARLGEKRAADGTETASE